MEFPSDAVWIEVFRHQGDLCGGTLSASLHVKVVIGDEHLALSDQLEVITVERAGKRTHVIHRGGTGALRKRRVICQIGRLLDTSLTWQVLIYASPPRPHFRR